MEEQLPLYEMGRECGTLVRREDGLRCQFEARCSSGAGVRKVWLHSRSGGRMLLGTLMPEQGQWRLRRQVASSQLRRIGLEGELWGEVCPPGEGQEPREQAPVTSTDAVIADALSRWGGRWRRSGRYWRLSYPWRVGERVPVETLFCFARVEDEELYYLLDGSGLPPADE